MAKKVGRPSKIDKFIEVAKEWRDVPNYEGHYKVSEIGDVMSVKFGKEKLLKSNVNARGYFRIQLFKDGKCKEYKVHQLVAMAFLNHKPNGYELVVDHIDRNKVNNYYKNLRLVSQRENVFNHFSSNGNLVGVKKVKNRYRAQIRIDNNSKHLGYYDSEQEAHNAYMREYNKIENYETN